MTLAPAITLAGSARIAGAHLFGPLTLNLQAGQWTCLLGESGVGKSTILRLIAGLDTQARFDGVLEASDDAPIGPRVAYMAQQDLLLPWASVRKNVTLGARLRGETVNPGKETELLEHVGLTSHAEKTPDALSGGQRQRVALARTLMEEKPIILLDEPFSALDARTRADMQDLAHTLLQGRTVLLVTHEPAEAARLADSIQLMTAQGLEDIAVPEAAPPRDVQDPATLRAQGRLLAQLRDGSRP